MRYLTDNVGTFLDLVAYSIVEEDTQACRAKSSYHAQQLPLAATGAISPEV